MSVAVSLDPSVVVWSVPAEERDAALATRPLLVLLHGLGSHEHDLFSLSSLLPAGPVIASLRAPLRFGDGFSWFPPTDPGLPSMEAADAATAAVLAWLDVVHPGDRGRPVGLLGFSQGGAMTTHLLRHAPERFTAYVNLAGFSIGDSSSRRARQMDARLESLRPPVFWGRDPADPVIPSSAVQRTLDWLPKHSTLTLREYPGIGHSISREELDDVNEFLAATLFI
ncbi:MAG: alpha/beta hydrolase [Lacisediminihabitans sp.]